MQGMTQLNDGVPRQIKVTGLRSRGSRLFLCSAGSDTEHDTAHGKNCKNGAGHVFSNSTSSQMSSSSCTQQARNNGSPNHEKGTPGEFLQLVMNGSWAPSTSVAVQLGSKC